MADLGNKIINLVVGLAIGFGVLTAAFLPQLAGWASDVSDINNTDYGWIVWLIAMVVVFGFLKYGMSAIGKKN